MMENCVAVELDGKVAGDACQGGADEETAEEGDL